MYNIAKKMKTTNKKANFNYKLESTRYEAGIALTGDEVKAFKANKTDLSSSHAKLIDNEIFLINANIHGALKPTRTRKLLLKRSEITSIGSLMGTKRLTFVPLSMYTKGRLIKVKLSLGKIKRKFEKKENLKKRAIKKQIRQELKK